MPDSVQELVIEKQDSRAEIQCSEYRWQPESQKLQFIVTPYIMVRNSNWGRYLDKFLTTIQMFNGIFEFAHDAPSGKARCTIQFDPNNPVKVMERIYENE